eukprot:TRINITY_DN3509_c0_g2_i1.p1 TRINITY_DN3509_c0_g2~~TRINITY_DN3509_c0_g2_i1.p1  ORF type:complete len:299 (+),score=44.33 TRINITY_DN3509_c0_g2_i1:54-950(+)
MASSNNVVIRNTFISVMDEEEAETPTSRPRLLSDPTPQHYQKQSAGPRGAENQNVETDTSTSSPRNFLHDLEESDASSSNRDCGLRPPQDHAGIPAEWRGKSSVMVRNISYKCTRTMFREELDKAGFENMYDYAYVPVNTGRGTSKGYAFVNFVDPPTAYRFKERFDGCRMDVPGGMKVLEVIPANLQGYSQNVSHYIDKQNELSAAGKTSPPLKSGMDERRGRFDGRKILNQARKPLRRTDDASQQENNETISCCHQCHNHVLSKSRFCHWCGAALHTCASAPRVQIRAPDSFEAAL